MKITGNEPVKTLVYKEEYPSPRGNGIYQERQKIIYGLTIRQYYAGLAMQGIMSQSHNSSTGKADWTKVGFGWGEDTCNSLNNHKKHATATIAEFSVKIADALIEELNKIDK